MTTATPDTSATARAAYTARVRVADLPLARLVMAATTLWAWTDGAAQARAQHNLLSALLDERRAGRAWLLVGALDGAPTRAADADDVAVSVRQHSALPDFARVEQALHRLFTAASPPGPEWVNGATARCQAHELARRLADLGRPGSSRGSSRPEPHGGTCRVFMDRDRFISCTEGGTGDVDGKEQPSADYYVTLDIRHDFMVGRFFTVVIVGAWSHWPLSRRHAPPPVSTMNDALRLVNGASGPVATSNANDAAAQPDAPTGSRETTTALRRTFHDQVRTAAILLLRQSGYQETVLRVRDEPYIPPVFWVTVPGRESLPPISQDLFQPIVRPCVQMFLKAESPLDCTVSSSVLTGDVLTFRRMLPIPGGASLPCYVLIPSRVPGVSGRVDEERAEQEEALAGVVAALSEMETHAAGELLTSDVNLEIIQNHLSVAEVSAHRAAALWDALATHLPVRRGYRLGLVHRCIALLHQVLLQSLADIDNLARRAYESEAGLNETAERLTRDFDRRLTEEHLQGRRDGLRASITRTGLLVEAVNQATETSRAADRVGTYHRNLLSAITAAFDERRARELDGLQKSNFVIGLAVAVIGVVTVLDAVVNLKPSGPDTNDRPVRLGLLPWEMTPEALANAAWSIGLLLVAVLLLVGVSWTFTYGVLTTRRFRRRYRRLAVLLSRVSTAELDRQAAQRREQPDATRAAKNPVPSDEELAREFARIFDEVIAWRPAPRSPRTGQDLRRLRRAVEQWAIEGLLFTERPRELLRYPLPLLTCMYRWASRHEACLLAASGSNAVADADFRQSMLRMQTSSGVWASTGETPAGPVRSRREVAERLDDFLRRDTAGTAERMLDRLIRMGVRTGMTSADVSRLLEGLPPDR